MSKLQQVCEEEMKWRVEYMIRLKTGEITFCPLTPLMPFFPAVPCRKTNKQTSVWWWWWKRKLWSLSEDAGWFFELYKWSSCSKHVAFKTGKTRDRRRSEQTKGKSRQGFIYWGWPLPIHFNRELKFKLQDFHKHIIINSTNSEPVQSE